MIAVTRPTAFRSRRLFLRLGAVWLPLLVLGMLSLASSVTAQSGGYAAVVTLDTAVQPASARYIDRAIDRAAEEGAAVVVLVIDTPGGLLDSTRDIVSSIFESPVPVLTYVSPPGAHAASAGTFITAAGHIAAMAPGTNIGAASPISGDGSDIDETLKDKVFEDTAAEIRAIAERRGRPTAPLEATVLEAKAYTAQEALSLGIVDLVSPSIPDLLSAVDGMSVPVAAPDGEIERTLETVGLATRNIGMGLFDTLLSFVSSPDIAFLLISLGGLGIYIEVVGGFSLIAPGLFGLVALALGFVGLGNLPANWVGSGLMLLAFGLLIAEMEVEGFGALGIMGGVSFVVGAVLLFSHFGTPPPLWQGVGVSSPLLITLSALASGFAVLVAVGSFRGRQRLREQRPATMMLVGEPGVVRAAMSPRGRVRVHGETWTATSETGEMLPVGSEVVVTAEDGALLTVRRAEQPANERQDQQLNG